MFKKYLTETYIVDICCLFERFSVIHSHMHIFSKVLIQLIDKYITGHCWPFPWLPVLYWYVNDNLDQNKILAIFY